MGDAIDRACQRAKVKAGSELEKLVRQNSYQIFGSGESDDADRKLDKFIAEQAPAYPDSMEDRAPAQKLTPKLRATDVVVFSSDQEREAIARAGLKP